MAEISQNVNIEMLEKLPDGTYKRKYPKTRADDGTTFDEHLADDVSQKETHGLRVENNKLEYFTGTEWKIASGGIPAGNVSGLSVKEANKEITLTWADPDDRYLDDVKMAEWQGTKIIRKEGSYPVADDDGTLVVDSKSRNQYATEGYKDTGLINDTTYYYMAFPYTEDAVTVDGANRVVGTPSEFNDRTDAPGPKNLISGTMALGFFGEVAAAKLITGNNLASRTGITQGSAQFSDTPWLKFVLEGKILFVAKKPIRSTISWDAINTAKCVYGDEGDKRIWQNGHSYKVRLLRGANTTFNPKVLINEQTIGGGYNERDNHYSEWNKLLCAVHTKAPKKSWAYPDSVETDLEVLNHSLGSGANKMYTDQDLHTHYSNGDGGYCWCQEVVKFTSHRLYRGHYGVSFGGYSNSKETYDSLGWRPVLEFIA